MPYKNGISENYKLVRYNMDGSAEDRYKPSKEIRNKTSMVRSDVWDFINAYIL